MTKKNTNNMDSLPLTPEEMKAIGEIELGPSRHELFLNAHYKKLIVALIIFMLVASATIVYGTWRARQESDAAAASIASLRVVESGADAAEFDLSSIDKTIADYPGTKAAGTAELLRGMQLLAGGQQQEGIAALEGVIASADNATLRLRAQVTLAGYYMDGGEQDKAMQYWQAVTREGASPWEALALLSMGDISVQQGNMDMAKAYYSQISEKCPGSPVRGMAQQRLAILGVDLPLPVAPEPKNDTKQDPAALPEWNSPVNANFGAPR